MYTPENSKTYTGTKTLKAWPATRGEFNAYRGWTIPADEDPTEAGYLVEYTDGGNPNHPNHDGYISWSPASVFERTYYETPGDWHSRLVQEAGDLSFRIDKLCKFVTANPGYETLDGTNKSLLGIQLAQMESLLVTLTMRLDSATAARADKALAEAEVGPAEPDTANEAAEPSE